MAAENEAELTAAELTKLDRLIDSAAQSFDGDGDHKMCCDILIGSLKRTGVPCFTDDVHHLVGTRRTETNVLFHKEVWPDFLSTMDDYLASNPELQDQLDAVREGRAPEERPEQEPEYDEPAL